MVVGWLQLFMIMVPVVLLMMDTGVFMAAVIN